MLHADVNCEVRRPPEQIHQPEAEDYGKPVLALECHVDTNNLDDSKTTKKEQTMQFSCAQFAP